MTISTMLLATVFLPAVAALAMVAIDKLGRDAVRWVALAVTVVTVCMAVPLVRNAIGASVGDEVASASVDIPWLPASSGIDVRLSLGLDGVSVWMFGLSALLMVTSVLVSWKAIEDRPALFYGMLLLLETGCLGVFAARDILLFYVFFEFTLIPLYFLIGIWGSEDRKYAATKFFLYTLAGSLLTFLGLLSIVLWDFYGSGSQTIRFSIPELTESLQTNPISPVWLQTLIFVALFAGFAIKVPLFPLHTWLPLAHVQAPTAGSVVLAGVLLKIGTYGFVRFSIPFLPDATVLAAPILLGLSVAGIIYGALVALAQSDIKRLIAYSSVSHLGFCMLGLFARNRLGTQGAMLQMVNHGLSTGGLFALVGMLYERYHTREIASYSGIARRVPVLAFFMLVFTFSSIGLPGLNGFVGEFMILIGMFQRGWMSWTLAGTGSLLILSVLSVSGVVLGAWYMLWLVQRVFFGPVQEPSHHGHASDLSLREIVALAPLALFVVWIGVYPQMFVGPMQAPLDNLTGTASAMWEAADVQAPIVETATRGIDPPRMEVELSGTLANSGVLRPAER